MAVLIFAVGCAKSGYLRPGETLVPAPMKTLAEAEPAGHEDRARGPFADSLIGFKSGTVDSSTRYLGRLNDGFVADTLNVIIMGDNRPGWRSSKLRPQVKAIEGMASLNPWHWLHGLIAVPVLLVRGTVPDLCLWRDIPDFIRGTPQDGREEEVNQSILVTIDSLATKGQNVAAVINSGDLVKDGRQPRQWERFLDITRPLYSRVPYMPIPGNHERTESPEGLANWHTATGLPIWGDRLRYWFDSADRWVRFIALDSNPLTDPLDYWPRDVETSYAEEQIMWLRDRLKEHAGPAIVLMHHPPFSVAFHRTEWQSDDMLRQRRADLVRILRESKFAVIVSGHEHAYERALLTCGDAVIIILVSGGAGAPLYDIPNATQSAALFSSYDVEGCEFKSENALVSQSYHYVHMRLWYGGGEFFTYAVDKAGERHLIDHVEIDLELYGRPKIDQDKMPILEEKAKEKEPVEDKPAGGEEEPASGADQAGKPAGG